MSKAALKKELKLMSHEQLEQIILDAYNARSEIKDYFEFFLNPDVDKLREKTLDVVDKELRRAKWGYCKARVNIIKNVVKNFAGYNPGPESVLLLMRDVILRIGFTDRILDLAPSHENLAAYLTRQMRVYGDLTDMADFALECVNTITAHPQLRYGFKRIVEEALE